MAIITKWRMVGGKLETTDHRPGEQWGPCFCPVHGVVEQQPYSASNNPNRTAPCGGDCPFFYVEEKGGETYAVLECYGMKRERKLETA